MTVDGTGPRNAVPTCRLARACTPARDHRHTHTHARAHKRVILHRRARACAAGKADLSARQPTADWGRPAVPNRERGRRRCIAVLCCRIDRRPARSHRSQQRFLLPPPPTRTRDVPPRGFRNRVKLLTRLTGGRRGGGGRAPGKTNRAPKVFLLLR